MQQDIFVCAIYCSPEILTDEIKKHDDVLYHSLTQISFEIWSCLTPVIIILNGLKKKCRKCLEVAITIYGDLIPVTSPPLYLGL